MPGSSSDMAAMPGHLLRGAGGAASQLNTCGSNARASADRGRLAQNKEEAQEAARNDAVFPCVLRILPTAVFNKKDPILLGVDILEGIAKVQRLPCCSPPS